MVYRIVGLNGLQVAAIFNDYSLNLVPMDGGMWCKVVDLSGRAVGTLISVSGNSGTIEYELTGEKAIMAFTSYNKAGRN